MVFGVCLVAVVTMYIMLASPMSGPAMLTSRVLNWNSICDPKIIVEVSSNVESWCSFSVVKYVYIG